MLLHVIAVLHKLCAHFLEEIVVYQSDWRLRSLASADHLLRKGLLFLQGRQPACVELLP
jgi:hypothetical protein